MKIKKLPRAQRKLPSLFRTERRIIPRILLRAREDAQFFRTSVQFAFALLCLWIGIEYAFFMKWGLSGGEHAFIERPPGVEGFLPISALISLSYWIETGIINNVHPAGLFILVGIALTGLLLKKAFCSWLCPVGTLSESLWELGQKLFGRTITVPRWLDYPLRAIKYVLLFFFAFAIWGMDAPALREFIYSPYNKVADIKMYLFFANITSFAFWTIMVVVGISVVIKNFWCRYLCPYGAFLGALSWLSPLKVTRNKAACIDCELCTKACPANIAVHKTTRVRSDECMSCYLCVDACPVKNTLEMKSAQRWRPIPAWVFGVLVVGVFVGVTGLAMLLGHWKNGISKEEYLFRMNRLDAPAYQHNQGEVPAYGPND